MQASLLCQNGDQVSFLEFFRAFKIKLKESFGEGVYSSWFANTEFNCFDGSRLFISIESEDIKNCLLINYADKFAKLLNREFERFFLQKLVGFDFVIQAKNVTSEVAEISQISTSNIVPIGKKSEFKIGLKLEARYIFENFVDGADNRLAFEVSKAFSGKLTASLETAGLEKSLFISGGIGNGKTHLAQSIANAAIKGGKRVLYITSDVYMFNYIDAIRENATIEFQKQFVGVDLLVIDDLHHVVQKKSTIESIYKIASHVLSSGGFVISAATNSADNLPIDNRFAKAFFKSFYQVKIDDPSEELRYRILKSKSEKFRYNISDSILKLLAHKISSSIRELETLQSKFALDSYILNDCTLDGNVTKMVLNDVLPHDEFKRVDVEHIVSAVCSQFACSKDDILSVKRSAKVAFARQIAMYLTQKLTSLSYVDIGKFFGNRTHSTAIYAIKIIELEMQKSPQLCEDIDVIRIKIQRMTNA